MRLDFQKFRRVYGIINGSETINVGDKNSNTFFLLRCIQIQFTSLIAVLKQRELVFLTDQLLRLDGTTECIVQNVRDESDWGQEEEEWKVSLFH